MVKWNLHTNTSLLLFLWCALAATDVSSFAINEAVDGDISSFGANPKSLKLEVGENTVTGSVGRPGQTLDVDIFRFSILPQMALTSIVVDSYEPNGQSFLGMQVGQLWTAGIGSGINGSDLTGHTLFGHANLENDGPTNPSPPTNLLPLMAVSSYGSSGFEFPLGPGDYVFLVQETGSPRNYGLRFTATAVPLPATLPLLAVALSGLLRSLRHREPEICRAGLSPHLGSLERADCTVLREVR